MRIWPLLIVFIACLAALYAFWCFLYCFTDSDNVCTWQLFLARLTDPDALSDFPMALKDLAVVILRSYIFWTLAVPLVIASAILRWRAKRR